MTTERITLTSVSSSRWHGSSPSGGVCVRAWAAVRPPAVLVAACLALAAVPSRAPPPEVYLNISKGFGEKVIVAVPMFERVGGNLVDAADVRDVLSFDLANSGFCAPVENTAFVEEAEQEDRKVGGIDFSEWIALGAEVLLKGTYDPGVSEFSLQAKLYDLSQGRAILGRSYTSRADEWRAAVHQLSDDIVKHLTGEEGIARSRIAFVSNVTGFKEIYVMDYDGENRRRVTRDNSIAIYPEWLPDRGALVYTRIRGDRHELCRIDLASSSVSSSSVSVLTSFPGLNAFACVSPRGDELLMTLSRDGNPEVYRLAVDGTRPRRLTSCRSTESSPSWSPSGRRIAFVSDRGGSPQIYIMSAAGGAADRVTYRGNYNTSPDWSPRGDLIVYTSRIDGVSQVCTVDVETKEVTRLTSGDAHKEDPSWAPDGRHVVYSAQAGGSVDLYMLDIYDLEPVRLTSGAGEYLSPVWSP